MSAAARCVPVQAGSARSLPGRVRFLALLPAIEADLRELALRGAYERHREALGLCLQQFRVYVQRYVPEAAKPRVAAAIQPHLPRIRQWLATGYPVALIHRELALPVSRRQLARYLKPLQAPAEKMAQRGEGVGVGIAGPAQAAGRRYAPRGTSAAAPASPLQGELPLPKPCTGEPAFTRFLHREGFKPTTKTLEELIGGGS